MSGGPRLRSMNCAEPESRPVLGPAGNKARTMDVRKQVSKPLRKVEKTQEVDEAKGKQAPLLPVADSELSPPQKPVAEEGAGRYLTVPSILRQQSQKFLKSNFSLDASCSSDASSDSSQSRASTGRISRKSMTPIRRKQSGSKSEKNLKVVGDTESESGSVVSADVSPAKKRCPWVTPNTDPCYVCFHDEEWGVPIHDDKKLFELLSFSIALAELAWPAILNKRHLFREVFLDFDPIAVSKLNEKKMLTQGSTASSLLSELKLRAIIENARQICKIIDECGTFDKYIWAFVNHKPIVGHFRYSRQVPIKTSKADAISKDLVRRGLRGVGQTVIYSFMQVAGITNDHLISCFRFQDCIAADSLKAEVEDKQNDNSTEMGIARAIDDLNLSLE